MELILNFIKELNVYSVNHCLAACMLEPFATCHFSLVNYEAPYTSCHLGNFLQEPIHGNPERSHLYDAYILTGKMCKHAR